MTTGYKNTGGTIVEVTKQVVKEYILQEFLPGENPDDLTDSTPLVTGGILDSIATMKLAAFLEERFGIALAAHDVSTDNLDTLEAIARLIHSKL
jgi:acyl carrier protein